MGWERLHGEDGIWAGFLIIMSRILIDRDIEMEVQREHSRLRAPQEKKASSGDDASYKSVVTLPGN